LTGSTASAESDYLVSALASKPRLTKYQVEMAASVEELKSSVEEMKAQFIGFQDMMKTALEKLDDFCNRTDQIIRAQVQKQAPKRSNFRT
jgi:hypothetical protein